MQPAKPHRSIIFFFENTPTSARVVSLTKFFKINDVVKENVKKKQEILVKYFVNKILSKNVTWPSGAFKAKKPVGN